MALPTLPKKSTKTRALTVRISEVASSNLKRLAMLHNMTQTMVIELLVNDAATKLEQAKSSLVDEKSK